jgi:predicted nucleic acid-binding protein
MLENYNMPTDMIHVNIGTHPLERQLISFLQTGLLRRVYIDLCCFLRRFDVKTTLQIEKEAAAMIPIFDMVQHHQLELAWSYVLTQENNAWHDTDNKQHVADWEKYAAINVQPSTSVDLIAQTIQLTGVHKNDALHVACAKVAQCQFFVTTDKRLLKYKDNNIILCNPVDLLTML